MTKLTVNQVAARQDAQDAQLEQMGKQLGSIAEILARLAGGNQAMPAHDPTPQPAPRPSATPASMMVQYAAGSPAEAKATREFRQTGSGGGYRVDSKAAAQWIDKRDRDGNVEVRIKNGVEENVKVKETIRLEDDTRVILDAALQTDFAGLQLAILTPEQIAILQEHGHPVEGASPISRHRSNQTGNLGLATPNRVTVFKTDRHGNIFEFATGTPIYMMAQRATLKN